VANGFLVPVFFVVLGASLNVRALVQSPDDLELAAALVVGIVVVHVLAGLVVRAPIWTALIVSAQLGVPAAVAQLGLAQGVLSSGQAAAIIAGALASLGVCATGIAIAKRATGGERGSRAPGGRSPIGHGPEQPPAPSSARPSVAP
jgi:Kef-type K+ transport system membrane component KefB